jgi:hypothetical protein
MTHSLHRQGTVTNLANDCCVMCILERGINSKDANVKAQRFLDIVLKYGPSNYGVTTHGNMYTHDLETLRKALDTVPVLFCVLASQEALEGVLRETKEQDFGLCIVVAGLYEPVAETCKKIGLDPHPVNHSLGVWGRTEKLPPKEILEIRTMCGHAQISSWLVGSLAEQVRKGSISA